MPLGMLFRPDGTNIPETGTKEFLHWVTVDFIELGGRTRPNSGESMMRLMAEQCRAGVATIISIPQHHKQKCCLSLPVEGDPELVQAHILWRAAEKTDQHWEEIVAGKETLDTKCLLGDSPWWARDKVNGDEYVPAWLGLFHLIR